MSAAEKLVDETGRFAEENGLIWGVTGGEPLCIPCGIDAAGAPFVPRSAEVRLDPAKTLKDVGSIIVIGRFYDVPAGFGGGVLRGKISAGMTGRDYHAVVGGLLGELAGRLSCLTRFSHMCFADSGPLLERALAARAGLGFYGRNGCLINPEKGSFFHIGYMLVDIELPFRGEHAGDARGFLRECAGCNKCVDACPGGALNGEGRPVCDYRKCVSYITQKKGSLSEQEMRSMGMSVMGCDICQRVCPLNSSRAEERGGPSAGAFPALLHILKLTDIEFEEQYRHTAAGWRGKEILQRNALTALSNSGDRSAAEHVRPFLETGSETLRVTARYAYERLTGHGV